MFGSMTYSILKQENTTSLLFLVFNEYTESGRGAECAGWFDE